MHITKLRIQNFRGLADVEFQFDQPVNVIVGPNAIGKTTVLEAVRLTHALVMPRYFQESQQVLTSLGVMSPHAHLANYVNVQGLARDASQEVRIRLELHLDENELSVLRESHEEIAIEQVRGQLGRNDDSGQLALTQYLSSDDGQERLASISSDVQSALDKASTPHRIRIDLSLHPTSGRIATGDPTGPTLVKILERRCKPSQALFTYFPADRAFPSGETNIQIGSAEANHQIQSHLGQAPNKYQRLKQTIVNSLLLSGLDTQPLQDDFSRIFDTLLPGKKLDGLSVTPVGTLNVSIRDTATDNVFDIDSMSSGEKGLILTFILLWRTLAHGGIALIDEPELHLNPAVARRIVTFICDSVVPDASVQTIICTHSSEILGAAFDRSDCTIHHLRAPNDATRIYDRDNDEVFDALRRLGTTAADSLFAKGTVFVEGDDDSAILEEGFFEQLAGYRVTGLGGRREIEKQIRTLQAAEKAGELDRLHCFIFDLDRAPAAIQSTPFVRVLQWDRYCLENYLIEPRELYDELRERGVTDLGSRGGFTQALRAAAQEQLNEQVARDAYDSLRIADHYARREDFELPTFEEIANSIAARMDATTDALEKLDTAVWRHDFVQECRKLFDARESDWADNWKKLSNGKHLIDGLYNQYTVSYPKHKLKRALIRRMKEQATEDWTLVSTKIARALDN